MYNISMKVGNKTISGILEDNNLTSEQIQSKGWTILRDAVEIHAPHVLRSDKGKSELPTIEYEEIIEPQQEVEPAKEKVYELPDLTSLSRKQLLEQKILAERKLQKIEETLVEHEKLEKEEIEGSLKEEREKGE